MKKSKKKKANNSKNARSASRAAKGRNAEILKQVGNLADPICTSAGMELVHVEFQSEAGGRTLRIYIDKPGGITLDDCAYISRQLGDTLDVYLENDSSYRLEVSSPGTDRPLGKPGDFNRFKGHKAKIRVNEPIDGIKNFTGVLMGMTDNQVELTGSSGTIRINCESINKARLINYNGEN